MLTDIPTISIIIPAYNRGDRILRSINSVLEQTFRDFELIIIDDGSTDNTKAVIERINDPRLKYYYQENAGACAARNHGIDVAKGKYIAFHDSDDIWMPDKLEKQYKIISNDSSVDIVYCLLVERRGNDVSYLPRTSSYGFVRPIKNLFGIGTITLLAKREVFEEFRFDEELPRFQEFELLYRATKKYTLFCLNEGLAEYDLGDDSISSNPFKILSAYDLIINKHPEILTQYPDMVRYMAGILQYAGAKMRYEKDKRYKEFYKKSLTLDSSLKSRLRIVLLNTKLLSLNH